MADKVKPLELAVVVAGSQSALAASIGVRQSTLSYWLHRSKRGVPAEYVQGITQATGIPPHVLRPDLFPRPAKGAA
jgi:DNA-binding transcriptional regulator YdaS (Cro superfamily)